MSHDALTTPPTSFPRSFLAAFPLAFLLLAPAPGRAQEEEASPEDDKPGVSEEIVVTARRIEESLQETPVAVTVFSADELEARSSENLRDLGDAAPNVTLTVSSGINGAPSEAVVYIRGIGHLGTGIFEDPGVGIYLDGVYLARAQGSVLDLVDVERIEILRGPQGTLFGKNTIGGAVSVVTRKPGAEFSIDTTVALGDLGRREFRERVGGMLGKGVFSSLSALFSRRDGYARSLALDEELNGDNRTVVRGALRFFPSSKVVVDWTADYVRERVDGLDQVMVEYDEQAALFVNIYNAVVASAGFEPYDGRWVTGDLYESYSGTPTSHDGDLWGTTLRVDWTFGGSTLSSLTSYRTLDFDNLEDRDAAPMMFVDIASTQEQDQLSQEFQLTGLAFDQKLKWLLGGLYFEESSSQLGETIIFENFFEAAEAAPGPIFPLPGVPEFLCGADAPYGVPCIGGAGNPFNGIFGTGFIDFVDHDVTSYALFGQGIWSLSERLSATFGLRYAYEEKELRVDETRRFDGQQVSLSNRDSWEKVSPKLGLELRAGSNALVYGSVAWGFKSGGFNGISQARDTLDSFDPEQLVAYEVGFKDDWLDHRLRLNAAAFWNDYTDIQFTAAVLQGTDIQFLIQNAGEAESKGFELELAAQPNPHFRVTAGVGYLDTKYRELRGVTPDTATLEGKFPKSPDWSVNLSPELRFDVAEGGEIAFRVDYSYRGRIYHDISNAPSVSQAPLDLVNARISFTPSRGRWELAAFATNLTDEAYIDSGIFITGGFGVALATPGRPREWGVSARFRF